MKPFATSLIIILFATKLSLEQPVQTTTTTTNISLQVVDSIPLVYTAENSGLEYGKPVLPAIDELPLVNPLTDPFMWSATDPHNWTNSLTARSTNFSDWSKRRSEIAWEIQHYEIGEKPVVARENVTATFESGQLSVIVTNPENGQTLTITAAITLPAGEGPFPAIIGINRGTGSLPASIFSSRNIAQITFSHNQVTTYGGHSNNDPFYRLYPQFNIDNHGQYAAWSWGVSRIIDGVEICQDSLPIDLAHIGVTGCSYAGKMALFAGAFDERIALTIAQESGGGGLPAWRVSETLGEVEKIGVTDRNWFKNSMFDFSGTNTSRLPHDHHELAAMIAPRALFHIGNPNYGWLADQSGHVSIMAAREVYKAFGIEDRIGFTIIGGHNHCVLPETMYPEVEAFVDKFLLGDMDVNTIRMNSIFDHVDHKCWINWWGTNKPEFSNSPNSQSKIWVGSWSCAPYAAGANNTPPSPYLANNTLRQVVRVSIGGDSLQVKFSNKTSSTPVTMNSVNIAVSTGDRSIDATTITTLQFDGNSSVTMDPFSSVYSDPVGFALTPSMRVAITIHYGEAASSPDITSHVASRTDSYILGGDHSTSADFAGSVVTAHWFHINTIDVLAPDTAGAVAILGNSITDGYGLSGGLQNRWTDIFSERLLENPDTEKVGVLNLGIGATNVSGSSPTSGTNRFKDDILSQSGLRWIIIFYGVNDIGGGAQASTLINAYQQMIDQAHTRNIKVYGATITPFMGSSYYSEANEAVRNTVNEWIRTPGNFDDCIDFDKAIRDPNDPARMLAIYSNDWLHPNAEGYAFLGQSVDLDLFTEIDNE